jgi:cation diffusion facilitator family transporter
MTYKRVQRTLILILVLNLIVAGAKGLFGFIAGSVSMTADAFHSLFDSVSNIIGILSTQVAQQPPDRAHPYGHGKFETFGTLCIGLLLLLSAYWIITEGYERLLTGAIPTITEITIGVMCTTIAINVFVAWYERKVGKELQSDILIADAQHTKSDIYVSLSVLAGFLVVSLGYPQADPIIAFGIGILIAKMGISIIKEAGEVLTDTAIVDCEEEVEKILMTIKGVKGYHKFRCRGKRGEIFADIHVMVNPDLTVKEGHDIARNVQKRMKAEIPGMKDVVVHIEPYQEGAA